jgi:hypothetical protein
MLKARILLTQDERPLQVGMHQRFFRQSLSAARFTARHPCQVAHAWRVLEGHARFHQIMELA